VKDSHGLFDYETSQVTAQFLRMEEPGKIIRNKQDVVLADKSFVVDKANEDSKGLANIGIIRGQYWVYGPSPLVSNTEEQLWIVLRNYIGDEGKPGFRLREGDVFKMGRCKYLLRELVRAPEDKKTVENMENTLMEPEALGTSVLIAPKPEELPQTLEPSGDKPKKDERQCRICLGEDNDISNPLIESPCACTGSVRLMHINCLKHWLQSKVTEKKTDCAVTYSWKQFECEVCKVKYPGSVDASNFFLRSLRGARWTNARYHKDREAIIILHCYGGRHSFNRRIKR